MQHLEDSTLVVRALELAQAGKLLTRPQFENLLAYEARIQEKTRLRINELKAQERAHCRGTHWKDFKEYDTKLISSLRKLLADVAEGWADQEPHLSSNVEYRLVDHSTARGSDPAAFGQVPHIEPMYRKNSFSGLAGHNWSGTAGDITPPPPPVGHWAPYDSKEDPLEHDLALGNAAVRKEDSSSRSNTSMVRNTETLLMSLMKLHDADSGMSPSTTKFDSLGPPPGCSEQRVGSRVDVTKGSDAAASALAEMTQDEFVSDETLTTLLDIAALCVSPGPVDQHSQSPMHSGVGQSGACASINDTTQFLMSRADGIPTSPRPSDGANDGGHGAVLQAKQANLVGSPRNASPPSCADTRERSATDALSIVLADARNQSNWNSPLMDTQSPAALRAGELSPYPSRSHVALPNDSTSLMTTPSTIDSRGNGGGCPNASDRLMSFLSQVGNEGKQFDVEYMGLSPNLYSSLHQRGSGQGGDMDAVEEPTPSAMSLGLSDLCGEPSSPFPQNPTTTLPYHSASMQQTFIPPVPRNLQQALQPQASGSCQTYSGVRNGNSGGPMGGVSSPLGLPPPPYHSVDKALTYTDLSTTAGYLSPSSPAGCFGDNPNFSPSAALVMQLQQRKMYTDDRDRMVYVSWIPKKGRAYNAQDKRKMELDLKQKLKDMGLIGLTKVLLFPPKGVHCKLIFDNRLSAAAFMKKYGGENFSLETEAWKTDMCKLYDIDMHEKFDKTVVKIEWSQK